MGGNIGELISSKKYTKKEWESISLLPFYKNLNTTKLYRHEPQRRRTAIYIFGE